LPEYEGITHISEFKSVPIISIHCWFDKDFMDRDFVGLVDIEPAMGVQPEKIDE